AHCATAPAKNVVLHVGDVAGCDGRSSVAPGPNMPSVCRPVAASALTTGTGLRFIGGLARNHDHQEERNEALAAGKRRVVVASAVVLGAAVIAAAGSPAFRSVDDPKGDVKCRRGCSDSAKRNPDIVKAKASHDVGQLR